MYRALLSLLLIINVVSILPAGADVLKGRVEQEDLRLHPAGNAAPMVAPPMRLARPSAGVASNALQGSAVDSNAFAPPLNAGRAKPDALQGVANDFAQAPKNFDIGAERGSKEMVLAWERWHKQLSEAIYTRWQRRVRTPGKATIRVDVTRNRQIRATILGTDGDSEFIASVMEAIEGLNGNQGLTFPAKSLRENVSFEADYVAATNVNPGFSWVKNDYEKIRSDY